MEPRMLTEWEKRERDGLLALETAEWREKRLIAEDPNTTADVLECLAQKVEPAQTEAIAHRFPVNRKTIYIAAAEAGALLTEALAKHPNTSPDTLLGLFQIY